MPDDVVRWNARARPGLIEQGHLRRRRDEIAKRIEELREWQDALGTPDTSVSGKELAARARDRAEVQYDRAEAAHEKTVRAYANAAEAHRRAAEQLAGIGWHERAQKHLESAERDDSAAQDEERAVHAERGPEALSRRHSSSPRVGPRTTNGSSTPSADR